MAPDFEDRVMDALYGNGQPGVLVRMAKLETRMALLMWVGGLAVSAVAGAVVTGALS